VRTVTPPISPNPTVDTAARTAPPKDNLIIKRLMAADKTQKVAVLRSRRTA
jgi:hypothetical protein